MSRKYTPSFFKQVSGNPDISLSSDDFENRLQQIFPYFNILNKAASFFFAFDFLRMRYQYVSDGAERITGYSAKQWVDGGLDWAFSLFYEEDAERLKTLHAALFDFYYSIPISERKDYQYAYELHLVRADGRPIWLLHQGSFIELCADGKPAITFDMLTDITEFKKDKTMTLCMSKSGRDNYTLHFPIEGDVIFSAREIEILKLLSADLTSKEIGERLFISSHTADTHRRNMLKKCRKKNSTALVFYAKENGLI